MGPRSLISAFVIRLLERKISKLASGKISIFKLISVAEETGLSFALTDTPKTGFVAYRPIYCIHCEWKCAEANFAKKMAEKKKFKFKSIIFILGCVVYCK